MQIIIDVSDDYVPEEGDALDAVTAALEFAEIPASLMATNIDAHKAIGLVYELAGPNGVEKSRCLIGNARKLFRV